MQGDFSRLQLGLMHDVAMEVVYAASRKTIERSVQMQDLSRSIELTLIINAMFVRRLQAADV